MRPPAAANGGLPALEAVAEPGSTWGVAGPPPRARTRERVPPGGVLPAEADEFRLLLAAIATSVVIDRRTGPSGPVGVFKEVNVALTKSEIALFLIAIALWLMLLFGTDWIH